MALNLSKPFINARGLPRVRPILEQWVDVCRTYQSKVQGDRPWYYHERAQIGFLAAASWLSDGVALEEWRTEKKAINGDCRNGRGDIWIQRRHLRLHVEAKHTWVSLTGRPASGIRRVTAKLRMAQRDACDISCGRDEICVGVLFAVPVVRRAVAADAANRFRQWLDGLQKLDCLAVAAIFDPPELDRRGTDNLLPGVALLIGRATRAA